MIAHDRLGPLQPDVASTIHDLVERDAIGRLFGGDHTLWSDDPTELADRLGWIPVVDEMLGALRGVGAEVAAVIADVDHVLLMGMGGSSLFPEVVARLFAPGLGHPTLTVLDTTDPSAIARIAAACAPESTLHIAASKSGSTIETRSHLEWAWARHGDPARFAVVTDPASALGTLARDRGFAAVFENRPDIGGRYSALSMFGVVPALTTGIDVEALLHGGLEALEQCMSTDDPSTNPALVLGATMAAGARAGRDKLTVHPGPGAETFGLWIEQLVAESTGKHGTGVLPVIGEPLGDPSVYGDDRIFVLTDEHAPAADALAAAGHPVLSVPLTHTEHQLGWAVVVWELATALCGAALGINPFDQPDVAAAKEATALALADGIPDIALTPAHELLAQVAPGDYVSIHAYCDPSDPVIEAIEAARAALRDRYRVATTIGLGPRFLHSTGQLHKGGPPTGVFLQVVGDEPADIPIPGQPYTFRTLELAQAAGDLTTLRDRGRRAGRVALDDLLPRSGGRVVTLGIVGLGKMGGNMLARLREHEIEAVGFDAFSDATEVKTLADLTARLDAPRAVWVMVPSGEPTESTIAELADLLEPGDVIIDGGNSNYHDSIRRGDALAQKGLGFIDCGTSGGVWGRTEGYCLMVGGAPEHVAVAQPVFDALAPAGGFAHVGPVGTGHFTKMVHNGIEYGLMQAYAEGYELLVRSDLGIDAVAALGAWRKGSVVRSWLLELLVLALEGADDLEGIAPVAMDSGEGRWTLAEAVDKGVATPVIAAALFARFVSQRDSIAMKVIAALRQQFGGHAIVPEDQPEPEIAEPQEPLT